MQNGTFADQKKRCDCFDEGGQYASALAAFKSVEADGLDCDAEIRECEPGFLGVRNDSYPKPLYVTRGEPTGKAKKVQCSDSGKVKVHSMTRVDLDNGCVRYTVDCTLSEGCESVGVYFNTPCSYRDLSEQPQGRKTFVFDVLKKDAKKAGELWISFYQSDGYIRSRNAY